VKLKALSYGFFERVYRPVGTISYRYNWTFYFCSVSLSGRMLSWYSA